MSQEQNNGLGQQPKGSKRNEFFSESEFFSSLKCGWKQWPWTTAKMLDETNFFSDSEFFYSLKEIKKYVGGNNGLGQQPKCSTKRIFFLAKRDQEIRGWKEWSWTTAKMLDEANFVLNPNFFPR